MIEVTYNHISRSFDRKCKKHESTSSRWKDTVADWTMIRIFLTRDDFNKAFVIAENIAEDDWIWSSFDFSNKYSFYFMRKDDAIAFKLKYENSSKQVS